MTSDEELEDTELFSAASEKDENGISISWKTEEPGVETEDDIKIDTEEASSSDAKLAEETATSSEKVLNVSEPIEILEKASELLETENYSEAYDALLSVEDSIGMGEVKGVEELASSSVEEIVTEEEVIEVGTSTQE